MAVTRIAYYCKVYITVQSGVSASGNPVYHNVNYAGVKPTAIDQDIFDVLSAIASLQTYPVSAIGRLDATNLLNA